MGKKTRIVLLSVTVAIAVFTFSAMWIVRPSSQSPVLDAAKERQNEPLLSVSEPLETDAAALSAEEEMAGKVSEILSSDEDFIADLAAEIAGRISLDEYIPEITGAVYEKISGDYDSIADEIASRVEDGLEDDVIALYEKYKKDVTADLVLAILDEYDALSDEEKSDVLSLEPQLRRLYAEYRDELISDLPLSVTVDGISDEELESVIRAFYDVNRSEIIADVGAALSDEYGALSDAERAEKLGLEAIYIHYRDAIVSDILSELPDDGITEEEAEALAYRLYDENRDAIVSDIENQLIEDYSALSAEEKAELLALPEEDIEEQAVALYDKYREDIAADVASQLAAVPAEISYTEPAEAEPVAAEEPEMETAEEPAAEAPARTPIAAPSFASGGMIAPDAPAADYDAARTDVRRAEIEKALEFIAE